MYNPSTKGIAGKARLRWNVSSASTTMTARAHMLCLAVNRYWEPLPDSSAAQSDRHGDAEALSPLPHGYTYSTASLIQIRGRAKEADAQPCFPTGKRRMIRHLFCNGCRFPSRTFLRLYRSVSSPSHPPPTHPLFFSLSLALFFLEPARELRAVCSSSPSCGNSCAFLQHH